VPPPLGVVKRELTGSLDSSVEAMREMGHEQDDEKNFRALSVMAAGQ
jgi:hypothetical protein